MLNLPIVLARDVDNAEAILALRSAVSSSASLSHLRKHSNLGQMTQDRQLPIYTMKANTIPQITRTLRQVLNMGEPDTIDDLEQSGFAQTGSSDELDPLEEARRAVEQIVIPQGRPVDLLPRSAAVRKMQHELVEHYRLNSSSFGEEPNCRLRIYPA
jgi:hypothetical protein